LSIFSSVICALNVLSLISLYWHTRRMEYALKRHRFVPEDRSRLEAALFGLPSLARWWLPIRLVLAFCLSTPILLATNWRWIIWWTDPEHGAKAPSPSLTFPAIVFLVSVALVRKVQRTKSRAWSRFSAQGN
jgi:hypothetical protein